MKTIEKVREELSDIRHYYANIKDFERANAVLGKPTALKMVEQYNRQIKNAPIKLFNLYMCLYVENNLQEAVSVDWNYSLGYIKVLNRKLYEFFIEESKKEENGNDL